MSARRWVLLICGLLVVAGAVALSWLPEVVRRVAVAQIQAATRRPVSIEHVDLDLLAGRFTMRGFRLAERDGQTPFADFARLDVRVHWPSLLGGHLRLREIVLTDSTVRVVRLPGDTFNFSDLVEPSGPGERTLDVTVDRFVLTGGKATLEDHAAREPRTWASESIEIEARDLSTRRGGGRAVARSVTAGAPVTMELEDVRLHPIRLRALVTMENLDVALARLYLPPDAAVIPERGRVSTSMTVVLDAREGLRADATGRLEDLVLVGPAGGEPLALVPKLTTRISGFAFGEGGLRLEQLSLDGAMSVRDPIATRDQRFRLGSVRASVADLTWPATTPGRLDLSTTLPGGGTLAVTGSVRPPPDATQLRVRVAGVDLAPWAQFLPTAARITGRAEADLRMNEPLAAGVPARVQGTIAVNRPAVADARHEVASARRVEASGLELHWPTRLVVRRVLVSDPRGTVERDRSGGFPLTELANRPASASPAVAAPASGPPPSFGVDVGEIVVRNGAMAWRDASVSPAARLDVSGVDATVTGIGWPLRGPARVRAALRPPGGGELQVSGRVGFDPPSADVRVLARSAELAPYGPYLPTTAHVTGAADLDVAVVVPSLEDGRATARGRAALSRVDLRDGERTIMRVERATASGLEVDWPRRVTVGRLALAQPWILVERDDTGGLALRSLLTRRPRAGGAPAAVPERDEAAGPVEVTIARLSVEGGGARVVDHAVSPPFAVDLQSASLRVEGLSTADAKPARLDLSGRLGPGSELALRGTVGALGRPLRLDVNGELREFALPRTNPYLLRQVGWKTMEGRLTSRLQCRIDGDALSARTDIRLSRLQMVRAAAHDGAQARIGLPLGVLTALMKDSRGDINVSLPVGGRLGDPKFDFSEAVWGAVRAVAINAVTLPVSWIGRVRFRGDSRIERIDVDPVTFEPGTAVLTAEGRTQLTRLTAFLDQLPEVRLALTPVVASRDVDALRRRPVQAAIAEAASRHGLSRDAAIARVFARRFPGQPVPALSETAVATLIEAETVSPAAITELGARRLDAVRGTLERAAIDAKRLPEMTLVQDEGREGRVEADIVDGEAPRSSRMREMLRRLGTPRHDAAAER